MKTIELSGIVGWDITAQALKNRLPRDNSDVHLKVDSVGGSVYEGHRLFNLVKDYPGKITIELGSIAASASSYWPMAVGRENITVRENTTFMAHKAWAIMMGNSDALKKEAEILDGFDIIMSKAYAKVSGRSSEELLDELKDDIWLIGGQAVVDAGFADSVAEKDEEGGENNQEMAIIDKSEIQARIEEAKITLKKAVEDEDMGQWAARIKADLNKADTDEQGQNLLFEETAPVSRGNNIKEADMDFNAYLDQNPEAKAEFEKQRNAYAKTAVDEALKVDRERSAKVAKLFGNSEAALSAIAEGKDVAAMALEEKEKAAEARKNQDDQDLGKLDKKKGQLPEKPEIDKNAKAQEDALDKFYGKKGDK